MKTSPFRSRLLLLAVTPLLLLTSCASNEDLRAALHDYNDGRMSYQARRQSQMDVNMERRDTNIGHLVPQ